MILFLTGMPGSGKSYWAEPLSKSLGFASLDMDACIEEREGRSVLRLFEDGEDAFRKTEKDLLTAILREQRDLVVATGGGTPCFFDNLEQMKAKGIVIYLKKSIKGIMDSLKNAPPTRPLLGPGPDISRKQLEALLAEREPIYRKADLIIDADTVTLPNFVRQLNPFLT